MQENKSNNTLTWVLRGLLVVLLIEVLVLAVMLVNQRSQPTVAEAPETTQPGEPLPTAQPPESPTPPQSPEIPSKNWATRMGAMTFPPKITGLCSTTSVSNQRLSTSSLS